MKKLSICFAALLSLGLVSCDEDFMMPSPQSNAQESVLQLSDITVTKLAQEVDINAMIDATGEDSLLIPVAKIAVKEGAMPANTILKGYVDIATGQDFANYVRVPATEMTSDTVFVSPKALQEAYYNNVTRSPKAKTLYVRSSYETVTNETSVASVGQPGNNYYDLATVNFVPQDMHLVIENAYYYVGALTTGQEYKFVNSGADPYDDPVFTCTIPALGDGWHWFRIAGESEYTNGNIDWDKENALLTSICPVVGDDTALEGKCMNGTKSWHLDEAANPGAKYKIEVNVMDMTIKITPIPAVPEYYIVGRQNNWQMSKVSAFYPTSASTISYTSYFTNAWDCRIATPENAAAGVWDSDFGATENGSTVEAGSLVPNSNNCIASPGVGYYTLTADMENLTYKWTKVDGEPTSYDKIGLVGAGDDWDNDVFLTKVAGSGDLNGADTHNWSVLGVELKDATWGVKFRANAGWDVSWGQSNPTTAGAYMYGKADGSDNIPLPGAGTYNIYFNDITHQFLFVKL